MRFRLVDRVLSWQPRRCIRGTKCVSFEEYRLKAAFGDDPHLPETLLMESVFQLGNWLIVLSSHFTQMGLLVRFRQMRFLERLRPGETMRIDVDVRGWRDDGIAFDGRATVGDRLLATGEGCLAVPAPLEEYSNPDDLRVLFAEIGPRDDEATGGTESS